MKYIKKFNNFNENVEASPRTAPTKPSISPDVKPGQPKTRPSRPSPIPSKNPNPGTSPLPKAKKSTEKEVADRFISELKKKGSSKVELSSEFFMKKYGVKESVDTDLTEDEETIIMDFNSLVDGDYSKQEAYDEILKSYDKESLTDNVLCELERLKNNKN